MGLNNNFQTKHINLTKSLGVTAQVGNDSTPFNKTQTDLISAISGTENSITVLDVTNGCQFVYTLLEGQANGEIIKEIIYRDTVGDGQIREVIPDTSKNDTLQVKVTSTILHNIN